MHTRMDGQGDGCSKQYDGQTDGHRVDRYLGNKAPGMKCARSTSQTCKRCQSPLRWDLSTSYVISQASQMAPSI